MGRKLFLLCAVLAVAPHVYPQTVDDIVQKNLQASGGIETLKAKNSLRLTGTLKVEGMDLPITIYRKRPDMLRTDVSVQRGVNMIDAFDGAVRWKILPIAANQPPEKATADETADMKAQSDFDPEFMNYKAKGRQLELVGKEAVDGKDAYRLKMTLPTGETDELYIDAATFLLVKQVGKVHTPQGEQSIQTLPSDYRPVDGVMLPHRIRNKVGETTEVEILIQKAEWNVDVPDSLFKMPAK